MKGILIHIKKLTFKILQNRFSILSSKINMNNGFNKSRVSEKLSLFLCIFLFQNFYNISPIISFPAERVTFRGCTEFGRALF